MTYTDNLHMGSSVSVHSSSAAAPAHLNPATDPLNLLQNPQMAVGYLPDQMQSHSFPQSFQSQSGRSTPSAANPQTSRSVPATQQQQQQQQQKFGDTWNDDIAFFTALSAANNPPTTAQHNRRQSTADIDALFLAPDAALPQASLVDAPHPDQFETELENFLASADPLERSALDAYNPVVDYTHQAFTNYRLPGTYSVPGAHSIITASSESGYDDFGSESYYNPYSPQGSLVNAANPTSLASLHFGIEDFQALNFNDPALGFDTTIDLLTPISQAPPVGQSLNLNPPGPSAISLDLLTMPSSINSQQTQSSYDKDHDSDGSQRSDGSIERERKFGTIPGIPGQQYVPVPPQSLTDARKKYQCPSCPRGLHLILLSKSFTEFALFCSVCPRVQPQDSYSDSRPQPPQALRVPSQGVQPLFLAQTRSWTTSCLDSQGRSWSHNVWRWRFLRSLHDRCPWPPSPEQPTLVNWTCSSCRGQRHTETSGGELHPLYSVWVRLLIGLSGSTPDVAQHPVEAE